MARVILNPMIDSISGKLGNVIFKTRKGSDGKPKTTMHSYGHFDSKSGRWVNNYERAKPLSKNERRARKDFAIMVREVAKRQAQGDRRPKNLIWADVKQLYGAKRMP